MKRVLILIPGNPSIPGIYDTFTEQLRQSLVPDDDALASGSELQIYVLSHRGQSAAGEFVEGNDKLARVVDHHRNQIDRIIEREAPDALYLVGHSLGSSIAVILYPYFAPSIDKLILLCPFLGPAGSNRTFLRLMSVRPLNRLLQRITRSLLSFRRPSLRLLERRLGLDDHASSVYQTLITRHFLTNFLSLTTDYTRFFQHNPVLEQLRELPLQQTLLLFAGQDYWAPDGTIERLPEDARCLRLAELEHAFCLRPLQAQTVARISAAFIDTNQVSMPVQ